MKHEDSPTTHAVTLQTNSIPAQRGSGNRQVRPAVRLTDMQTELVPAATSGARVRTPYHELGTAAEPHVPAWAGHRSVYRSGGRTLYLVETDHLDSAQCDLDALAQRGWDVRIDTAGGTAANIALTRAAA